MVRAWWLLLVVACSSSAGPADWMSEQEDTRGLGTLTIPGTHDTGALYDIIPGLSKTQDLTIAEQLDAGARFFDVRCRHYRDRFLIFHGAIDQRQTFDQVLDTMIGFLDAHPEETLLVSVNEEGVPADNTRSFETTFGTYIARTAAHWSLDTRVPALGDVRGKLVLFRRFPITMPPLGIDATAWPDNSPVAFSVVSGDANLRIQDAYVVTSNDEKWQRITGLLDEARASTSNTLYLNFTSGYLPTEDGLSNIPSVSDDINVRLDALLADPAYRRAHLGTLVMDHVTAARLTAVAAFND